MRYRVRYAVRLLGGGYVRASTVVNALTEDEALAVAKRRTEPSAHFANATVEEYRDDDD